MQYDFTNTERIIFVALQNCITRWMQCLKEDDFQTFSLVISTPRRVAENRTHYGAIRTAVCANESRYFQHFWKSIYWFSSGVFPNADVCHTISYSCIMLNTLLHNPNVKDRPTFERYQLMNKARIDFFFFLNFSIKLFQELLDNESVSVQVLQNCYDSIRTKPFKIPEDETSQFSRLNFKKTNI